MVLLEQISALLDFLERQPELALGYCSRTNEGRSLAKRRWVECAKILNSIAADCPKKSPAEWRTFFNEYKSKMSKKIKLQKREINTTGPSRKFTLTPLQKRLHDILERDSSEPLAGVNHTPPSPPRRRCQKPARVYLPEDTSYSDLNALETAQSRLERMETMKAQATIEHAQATNNLAAAIDRLGATTEQASNRLAAAVEMIGDVISLFVSPTSKNKNRPNSEIRRPSDAESD